MSAAEDLSPGTLAQLASIIEATARKPGNVHPGRSFADTSYTDFVLSAAAIAPALDRASRRPLGRTILDAVRATRALTGKNTNLGIVLLLAPLAALAGRAPARRMLGALASRAPRAARRRLRRALRALLARSTRRDAELAYEAIRIARPAGLGAVPRGDVRGAPAGTLLEMMRLASRRDLVARQYANGYREALEEGLPALARALWAGRTLEEAVVLSFLEILARHEDSLIARKCGRRVAAEASRRARAVLASGWPQGTAARRSLRTLDRWLRARGNQRNPGTSADLTAAVLFLALAGGIIRHPVALGASGHSISMGSPRL